MKKLIIIFLFGFLLLSCSSSKLATITVTVYDWQQETLNHLVIYTTYKSSRGIDTLPIYATYQLQKIPVLYAGQQVVITYDTTSCQCNDHSTLIDIKKIRFKK